MVWSLELMTVKLYRHKKRGGTYRILHHAMLQLDGPHDNALMVVYQDVDMLRVWTRREDEFLDGRFEEIVVPEPEPPHAPVNNAWQEYRGDFDSMSDEEIAEEVRSAETQLDEAESWLEAVHSWEAAGKPRNQS
jgi:hypothetical protein